MKERLQLCDTAEGAISPSKAVSVELSGLAGCWPAIDRPEEVPAEGAQAADGSAAVVPEEAVEVPDVPEKEGTHSHEGEEEENREIDPIQEVD